MADNVAITAGSGTTIAADDIGAGVLVQRVKAVLGADGSGVDPIAVSAALDSTGAGVQATGMMAQLDDVATATVTENQFAVPRISSRRALLVEGVASGTALHIVVDSGTVTTVSTVTAVTSITNVVHVDDNSGSLTVDAPVGTPVFCTPTPSTTGGWSKWSTAKNASSNAPLTNAVQTIKSGAATFGGYVVYNPNAAVAYLQVFDSTTASLGTTKADMIFAIPAGATANLEFTNGVNMATGIQGAVTTTATGSTAMATAGLDLTVLYK